MILKVKTKTISKNSVSSKNLTNEKFFKRKIYFALLATTIIFCGGCNKNNGINKKFIGKWETQSIVISSGYEFTTDTYRSFVNGVKTIEFTGLYSKGNRLHQSKNEYLGLTLEVSNDILTIKTYGSSTSVTCQKVSKFSWEEEE